MGRKGLRALVVVYKDDVSAVWTTDPTELRRHLEDARIPSADKIVEEIERGVRP